MELLPGAEPPLVPGPPVPPLVEPVPVVAPGAEAGISVPAVGLGVVVLGGVLALGDGALGDLVLGVVVVLELLLVSSLPQPCSAAATSTNIKACLTMSMTSNVTVGRNRSIELRKDASAMPGTFGGGQQARQSR